MKKPTMKEVKDWTVENAEAIAAGVACGITALVCYSFGRNQGIKEFGKEFVKWRNVGAVVTLNPRTGQPMPLLPWCDVMEKSGI